MNDNKESFRQLASTISEINQAFKKSADSAINKHVTCRNWLTGYYIVHYEQNGSDRAKYGERLLQNLEERLSLKGFSYRDLRLYRQFFLTYRGISAEIARFVSRAFPIWQSLIAKLEKPEIQGKKIWQSVIAKSENDFSAEDSRTPAELLFNKLSYTHLVQSLPIDDPLERTFYEIECIRGTWSVRELKRQIRSGYFHRCCMSKDKDGLQKQVNKDTEQESLIETIKSPFVFEFLGFDGKDIIEESDLETALMDHLQDFLLELGTGFCFEARQKRILVDEEYFFMDIVFYNRIARFGVIIELKSHKLDYKDIAQLNMYLAYYRKNMMQEGDNPPIGILLCTDAGKEMVEYATTGIDEHLLISKYMLELPSKEELQRWLHKELKALGQTI